MAVDTTSTGRATVFGTALYHAMIKPCLAADESPNWAMDGPFAFDVCTMWDIYRTQLPLLTTLFPERAAELANALLHVCEQEGNFPIGYRMAKGADHFGRQGSALVHTFLADLCQLGVPGIDWDWALTHMDTDLRRAYGEDFLLRGVAHPISHTLDLAEGYRCTAVVARALGDSALATERDRLSAQWRNAYDPATGLVLDSEFYEGGKWNYSFRLVADMASRIELAGGDEAFVALLDRFFGFGADPVRQPGVRPGREEMAAGYALNRFEGLNNEPDMEAPWGYHFAGRPDRTAEVVHAAVLHQFGTGRGGLPGNDDSGGLSAWYVWASLGLFPVAGRSMFLISVPFFAESRIGTGVRPVTIQTEGFVEPEPAGPAQYVQSVTLDGQDLGQSWLSAAVLQRGGRLMIRLGPTPSRWGTEQRPPSLPSPHATHA